jgi:Mg2+-importing ATPase
MALATPLLPFLPLTATQILANNFLSDLPSLAVSADRVDPGQLDRPQHWDLARVRHFMLVFGLLSSVFDLLTFGLLLHVFKAGQDEFRSTWFVVSVLTELAALLVLRTALPAWRSRPAGVLLVIALGIGPLVCLMPWLPPVARVLGLVPLPGHLMLACLGIVAAYAAVTEGVKLVLVRRARSAGT